MIYARDVHGKSWKLLHFKRGKEEGEILATKNGPAQAVALPVSMFSNEVRKALREDGEKKNG